MPFLRSMASDGFSSSAPAAPAAGSSSHAPRSVAHARVVPAVLEPRPRELSGIGLSEQAIVEQTNLRYHRDPRLAIANIDSGQGNLVVLLNPTRIEQVKTCAEQGVKMPSKSTDFFPKMVAGLTMMPVGKGERL